MKKRAERVRVINLKCEDPQRISSTEQTYVPCMRCRACRISRRRTWASRIELESRSHPHSSMATLTYDDDHLPEGGTLVPQHPAAMLKRLRKRRSDHKEGPVRYFLVGEYGPMTWRPHYHVALFGVEPCWKGQTEPNRDGYCCPRCEELKQVWGHGFVHVINLAGAENYLAGYAVKGMTRPDHPALGGRFPEFARMSLKPGIGGLHVPDIAAALNGEHVRPYIDDVPYLLNKGGKPKVKLGRYLRSKVRGRVFGDEKTPDHVLRQFMVEMELAVSVAARDGKSVKDVLVDQSRGAIDRMLFWERFNKKAKL